MSLPTGYTEVQYIQSTGTQYVDTGIKVNKADAYKMILIVHLTSNDNYAGCNGYMQFQANIGNSQKSKITVDYANITETISVEDVQVSSTSWASYNGQDVKLGLFKMGDVNDGWFSGSPQFGNLYSCQIYNGAILIRNYIPCINPDGEAGLYDTVNSKFYGNAGTGVFFAGPPKVTLPSAYTQLEYILSSGTQIIDTGVTTSNTTKVEIDFEPTSLDAHHLMILGTRNTSSGGNQFVIGWTGHKSPAVWRSDYGSSQVSFTTAIAGVARHYAVKDGASCKIDTETVTNTAATFTSSYTLYLFGGNQANTAVSQITAKLYRCKIYTSDQLVRDLIPCMNAAGAIGLYDLVNSKFYANAGTGAFTAGPEVIWPSDDAIYVKVNGIWRQIDGIKLL